LEYTYQENENYRLNLQEKLEDKIKKLSSKNKENLEGIKKEFEIRASKSMQLFHKKLNEVHELNDLKLKENIEKPMIKYENWYIQLHKEKKKKEGEKKDDEDKHVRKLEYLEDLEKEREKIRQGILDNLKETEKKKNQIKAEITEKWRKKSMDMDDKYRKLLDTRQDFNEKRVQHSQEILERQFQSISRAKDIESCFYDNKFTIYEKSIVGQMESEKKIKNFLKEYNQAKSRSLLKKKITRRKTENILRSKEKGGRSKKEKR